MICAVAVSILSLAQSATVRFQQEWKAAPEYVIAGYDIAGSKPEPHAKACLDLISTTAIRYLRQSLATKTVESQTLTLLKVKNNPDAVPSSKESVSVKITRVGSDWAIVSRLGGATSVTVVNRRFQKRALAPHLEWSPYEYSSIKIVAKNSILLGGNELRDIGNKFSYRLTPLKLTWESVQPPTTFTWSLNLENDNLVSTNGDKVDLLCLEQPTGLLISDVEPLHRAAHTYQLKDGKLTLVNRRLVYPGMAAVDEWVAGAFGAKPDADQAKFKSMLKENQVIESWSETPTKTGSTVEITFPDQQKFVWQVDVKGKITEFAPASK